ncbi:hypothetical protein HALLA_07080 [Halostagnicola larsenii XH-48]|uniref:Halobacterial output domain-containing protein n=1 Tax=Halostagnicola larsenii XH-48 TaxID=797299 RepID=W0JJ60_9EURY|nr:HalOD1 output domain-containing protein [Halostagnicola larsenii]AHF98648.1 hypothetical protein HALLA_07080 [Halostagnicola larsenii XH-48]
MMKGTPWASAPGDNRTHVQYDRRDDEPPSVAVATALASFHNEDVTAGSTQLYQYIDPDALDDLFESTFGGVDRAAGTVRFEVDDAIVVVRPERVHVYAAH